MNSCRDMEGLIAASLYEPLEPAEEQRLQAHLASCTTCAEEHGQLLSLVAAIPNEPAVFTGDLRPILRENLARERRHTAWSFWLGRFLVTTAFLMCSGGFYLYLTDGTIDKPTDVVASHFDQTLSDVQALVQSGDTVAARNRLEASLAEVTDSAEKGKLQLEMADLEYGGFARYEMSYNIYKEVRADYPDVWAASSGATKERFDLLTEARDAQFQPLYDMDAAVAQGEQGIGTLEKIMAKYPGRTLASEALTTMASLVEGEGLGRLENLKAHCTNPIAVAQLDIRLGEGYWKEQHDPDRGRALLEGVASGPHEIPAKMANETLARLEQGDR